MTAFSSAKPRRRLVPTLVLLSAILVLSAVAFVLRNLASPSYYVLGREAPLFSLPDQTGRIHHLADYRGRPVVLAFFKDDSPSTDTRLISLRDGMSQMALSGAKVFAVASPGLDGRAIHDKDKLNYPVLADSDGKLNREYRRFFEEGRGGNSTFVIDADNRVVLALPELEIDPRRHAAQLMKLASCCFTPKIAGKNRSGEVASDFSLPATNASGAETLFGDKKPKAEVVLFMSSKCPCSQGYAGRLKTLASTYGARGVRFLGIVSSADETKSEIAAYAKRAGSPFPILYDAGHREVDRLKAVATPEAFVMDGSGIIRYHGRIDDSLDPSEVHRSDVRDALDALLDGRMPSEPETPVMGCAIARTISTDG